MANTFGLGLQGHTPVPFLCLLPGSDRPDTSATPPLCAAPLGWGKNCCHCVSVDNVEQSKSAARREGCGGRRDRHSSVPRRCWQNHLISRAQFCFSMKWEQQVFMRQWRLGQRHTAGASDARSVHSARALFDSAVLPTFPLPSVPFLPQAPACLPSPDNVIIPPQAT